MMMKREINILGSAWTIKEINPLKDPVLKNSADGYCDTSTRTIVVSNMEDCQNDPSKIEDPDRYQKQVIRHELIHAFLFECGLSSNSWADDEEIVDWIAVQFPKLDLLFQENGVL